jgi:hypothetical protein
LTFKELPTPKRFMNVFKKAILNGLIILNQATKRLKSFRCSATWNGFIEWIRLAR